MNLELFDTPPQDGTVVLGRQALVLRAFALPFVEMLWPALQSILHESSLRHMTTPGGHTMSVTTTSCGALGWVSDHKGYRYAPADPHTGQPWPAMPEVFLNLAQQAAQAAGLAPFQPDACLINSYEAGSKMSLHQDSNERDRRAPIVSVSLGIPAVFLFGGFRRNDKTQRVSLFHGDVVVWGGEDRMRFHGVLPLKPGEHSLLGNRRINLTFRQAG